MVKNRDLQFYGDTSSYPPCEDQRCEAVGVGGSLWMTDSAGGRAANRLGDQHFCTPADHSRSVTSDPSGLLQSTQQFPTHASVTGS